MPSIAIARDPTKDWVLDCASLANTSPIIKSNLAVNLMSNFCFSYGLALKVFCHASLYRNHKPLKKYTKV